MSPLERVLEQHHLALGQIDGDNMIEEALAAMSAMNPNFIVEERAIYDDIHAQTAAPQEAVVADAQLHAIAEKNDATCASYAPATNH
ncbi:Hydroxymethylglutaryl-CoA lyase, mitochondrial [Hordeum vulgare]|nr:Hydroxymethylglutaryl-CoA lyase, mitochondrial [Hordeum vulgare]